LNAIKLRNNAKGIFEDHPTSENKTKYNKLRNFCKNVVCRAKKEYYFSNFDTVNTTSIWRTYDKLMGKDVRATHNIPNLLVDGRVISNDQDKSEILSSAFILEDDNTIDYKLQVLDEFKGQNNDSLAIVDQSDVHIAFSKVQSRCSMGDKIPSKVLVNTMQSLLLPLSILFSSIFHSGEYPCNFKNIFVLPLYKGKGLLSDPNSYRPIASVPTLSKILDYILKWKVKSFVDKSNVLDDNQHGFRSKRSCETALLSL